MRMRGGFGRLPYEIVRRENNGMATLVDDLAESATRPGLGNVIRDNSEIPGPTNCMRKSLATILRLED